MHPEKPFRDYTAEEVIELAKECDWPSLRYQETKFGKHRRDWLRSQGVLLDRDEHQELRKRIQADAKSTIYYYRNKGGKVRFGIMASVKIRRIRLINAAIVIDPETLQIRGIWRIKHGKRYFEEQQPVWQRIR